MKLDRPWLCTTLEIWQPKYSDPRGECALLACHKVNHGTEIIVVKFTKAKHLLNQHFALSRERIKTYPIVHNGKISCYSVPVKDLESF